MYSHFDLVELSRIWLAKRCPVVVTEIQSSGRERPDALGFDNKGSVLIECKVSRDDFWSDKRKPARLYPDWGLGIYRYYMCPHGLIKVDELPDKWGLLYVKDDRVRCKKKAESFSQVRLRGEYCGKAYGAEIAILISALRRVEGVHIQKYEYHGGGQATLTVRSNESSDNRRNDRSGA